MAISAAILPEFDHEMANTRKTLERMPEGKSDWKPHEKSMTLGRLAGHLAELPGWGMYTLTKESIDVAPVGGPTSRGMVAESRKQALDAFDENLKTARGILEKTTDEEWRKPWTLMAGGKTIFTMPRVAVFRGMVMNHMIHHRAQFGVYLRLNNIPVPSIYGPSADESGM